MSAEDESFFGVTDNLKHAVELINGLPVERLPKLLQRIMDKLHTDDKPFSAEEEDKLAEAFEIETDAITLILNTIAYIYETTAYHHASAKVLMGHLSTIEMEDGHRAVFGKAWQAKGEAIITNFRDKTFFTTEASDVNWRLNLQLAQASQSKVKLPSAQFDIKVAQQGTDAKHVQLEFTHAELFQFYTQLELIQSQLDQLT